MRAPRPCGGASSRSAAEDNSRLAHPWKESAHRVLFWPFPNVPRSRRCRRLGAHGRKRGRRQRRGYGHEAWSWSYVRLPIRFP